MEFKKLYKRKLPGFSLIEVSIVLLIIGIIAGATLKGKDIIDSARLKSVANDIQIFQIAYNSYISSYGALPGDDKKASTRFSGVEDGDGNGKFNESDAGKVFTHLYRAGLIESETFKIPKTGGKYETISEGGTLKLKLSDSGTAFLSNKQIISLIAKCKEIFGSTEDIIETEPAQITESSSTKYLLKVKISQ
ncbi:MAG: prepilin-type N-terminal cleavage/methylation domain-containing protein [Holosporales bacterium]|jgi:prepilin-type N-terminal cleavage/methylation domain-containing protein|nr:prepilin-type N-terminal cleavage/methylation domain-containing protein [Holosporales bacterium]